MVAVYYFSTLSQCVNKDSFVVLRINCKHLSILRFTRRKRWNGSSLQRGSYIIWLPHCYWKTLVRRPKLFDIRTQTLCPQDKTISTTPSNTIYALHSPSKKFLKKSFWRPVVNEHFTSNERKCLQILLKGHFVCLAWYSLLHWCNLCVPGMHITYIIICKLQIFLKE